jgi:DNA-binding XRE family transcriptional regulator
MAIRSTNKLNPIQLLEQELHRRIPKVRTLLDAPEKPNAHWWLDAQVGKHVVSVEWRPGRGFGVSAGDDGFGEGPDEVYADAESASRRVRELLKTGENTRPPDDVLLARLRDVRRKTQQQLAEELGISQATVSKIERQSDMYLSTLRSYIDALGGRLEISAIFPEGTVRVSLHEEPQKRKQAKKGTSRGQVGA